MIAAGEAERIAGVVVDWLEAYDRPRPSFAVIGIEKGLPLALCGLQVSLRLDRMDALDDGGVAIIDYKTGRTHRAEDWFEPARRRLSSACMRSRSARRHPQCACARSPMHR